MAIVNGTLTSVTGALNGLTDSEPPLLTERVVPSSFATRRAAALSADDVVIDSKHLENFELNLIIIRLKKLFWKYKGNGSAGIYRFIIDNWYRDFPMTSASIITLRRHLACLIDCSEQRQNFMQESENAQNTILN